MIHKDRDFYGNIYRWFTAKVEDVHDDPEQLNRVRIRIYGVHDLKWGKEKLPLANVIMPPTHGGTGGVSSGTHGLVGDELVIGFFLDPDMQHPVVTGTFHGTTEEDQNEEEHAQKQYAITGGLGNSGGGGSSSTTGNRQGGSRTSGRNNPGHPSAYYPTPTPKTGEQEISDGVSFSDQGLHGVENYRNTLCDENGNKQTVEVPAPLRHNNPGGVNMTGDESIAAALGATGSQVISGNNKIASFDSVTDGYAYLTNFMQRRASFTDANGNMFTTPQAVGDRYQTAGYNGADLVAAMGNNNPISLESYSPALGKLMTAIETRELGQSKVNSLASQLGVTNNFGRNNANKEAGFNKANKLRPGL